VIVWYYVNDITKLPIFHRSSQVTRPSFPTRDTGSDLCWGCLSLETRLSGMFLWRHKIASIQWVCLSHWPSFPVQGVVTCTLPVEAFVTGVKMESSDQCSF